MNHSKVRVMTSERIKRVPSEDIEERFKHHPPTPERAVLHGNVRNAAYNMAIYWDDNLPVSREKSLAMTKLEEAVMWANAAIARNA
jgi:hypothetical protein